MEIPEILIESEKNRMLEEFKSNIKSQFQIDFKDYLAKVQKSEDEIRESFKIPAEKQIKDSLILKAIAEKEKIQASEKEIEEKINDFMTQYPSVEKAKKEVDLDKLRSYYEGVIKDEKVFQLLEQL